MVHVLALEIVVTQDMCCLKGWYIIMVRYILNIKLQRYVIPIYLLLWLYLILVLDFLRMRVFLGPSVEWRV